MGERTRWASGGRGQRGSLLVVTNGRLDDVAALLSKPGYFVLACRPEVAERAMSLFAFSALVLDEDVPTSQCSMVARAFSARPVPAPILHCWHGYPGGLPALVAEYTVDPAGSTWSSLRGARRRLL